MDVHLDIAGPRRGLARRIAAQLRDAVRTGRLDAGARLPPSRELAADLGVSRGVVVEAYAQLTAEGVLTARQGAGTRVAAAGAPGRPAAPYRPRAAAGRVGVPDLAAFPRRQWLAATRHVLATLPNEALGYPDPAGVPELRTAVAGYLHRVRAADVGPDDVTVVGGVAHGLALLVRVLAEPGGTVDLAVEDPTSPRQLPLLHAAGARIHPVPVDTSGMDIPRLAAGRATAVLLTPAHQYPTGVVLSPARRAELAAWLDGTAGIAIEDDYDAEFRYDRDPVGCLQGLRPDRTVLIGSVSKSLAPGLRLGWVAAPPPITARLRALRAGTDLGSPVLEQHVLARLLESGEYDRHVRAVRRRYLQRRDVLVDAVRRRLPEARVLGVSAGQHVYVELPGWTGAGLATAITAASVDVGVSPEYAAGEDSVVGERPGALVFGFAAVPERRLTALVDEVADALR